MQSKLCLISRRLCKFQFELIRKLHLVWYDHVLARLSNESRERTFQCNICGNNTTALTEDICSRDAVSCQYCNSTLRYRSIIHLLSLELFGKSILLRDFPVDKSIFGLGMSDWDGYAELLAEKFSYTNTFYHKEPRLDIVSVPERMYLKYNFVISSDVFEHVMQPVEKAFVNAGKLLKPEGVFLLTVPYMHYVGTWEHYPSLNCFEIITMPDGNKLKNITRDGDIQMYDDLVFHGGHGATLELRIYAKLSLKRELVRAGFRDIGFHRIDKPEFGIIWPINWSLPILARC